MLFFEIRILNLKQFLSGSLDAISKNYSNNFKITWTNFLLESSDLISQKKFYFIIIKIGFKN